MSAFLVDRKHVIYLVSAVMQYRYAPGIFYWHHRGEGNRLSNNDYKKGAELCNMLLEENNESLMARYGKREEFIEVVEGDLISFFNDTIDPVQLLKAIDCYAYQSCEHNAWQDSEAFAFVKTIKKKAISALPGYDEAKWEIT